MPLTVGFVRRAWHKLGIPISWRCARRVKQQAHIHRIEFVIYEDERGLLAPKRWRHLTLFKLRVEVPTSYFKLPEDTREILLSTLDHCQALMKEIFGGRAPP